MLAPSHRIRASSRNSINALPRISRGTGRAHPRGDGIADRPVDLGVPDHRRSLVGMLLARSLDHGKDVAQMPSRSSRGSIIGQALSDQLDMTVQVIELQGWCGLANETPASYPGARAAGLDSGRRQCQS